MKRGYLYLVMDWYSWAVLSWRISNTIDADFCVAALEDALNRYGLPEIFKRTKPIAVHQLRVYTDAQRGGNVHLHGWPWPLDGQHHGRETVEVAEIRMRVSSGTGYGQRTAAGSGLAERAA